MSAQPTASNAERLAALAAQLDQEEKESRAVATINQVSVEQLTKDIKSLVNTVGCLRDEVAALSKQQQQYKAALAESTRDISTTLDIVERLTKNRNTSKVRTYADVVSASTQTLPTIPPGLPQTNDVPTASCADTNNRCMHTPTHAPAAPVSHGPAYLSVKECMTSIESFYGNANKKADVVDASEVIAFNHWFDAALWKLDVANLSTAQCISVLCQKLQGPMLTAYMHKSKQYSGHPDSIAVLKQRLQELFADSAVHYTDKAFDMKFTSKNLVSDIQMFKTYVQNSSFASTLDQNEFVYGKLRSKMTAARTNILMLAASEFQMHLDKTAPFEAYVDQAIQIAHRVQSSSPKREADGPPARGESSHKAAKTAQTPKSAIKRTSDSKFVQWATLPDDEMLEKCGRCPKCAWVMRAGEHVRGHTCDPPQFQGRVDGIRHDLQKGKDPNAKVSINLGGQKRK